MITKRQIRFAMLISIMLHVLFAVGITSILAYKRSMPPINDDFEEAINIRSNNYYSSSINTKYFSREETSLYILGVRKVVLCGGGGSLQMNAKFHLM